MRISITDATGVIGRAPARQPHEGGHPLLLCTPDAEKLEVVGNELKGVATHATYLTAPEGMSSPLKATFA
jgi:NADP-dependent 3-hydroxy acid dehydrogenase YdfG